MPLRGIALAIQDFKGNEPKIIARNQLIFRYSHSRLYSHETMFRGNKVVKSNVGAYQSTERLSGNETSPKAIQRR